MFDNSNCKDIQDIKFIEFLYSNKDIFGVFLLNEFDKLIIFSDLYDDRLNDLNKVIKSKFGNSLELYNITNIKDIDKLRIIFGENNIVFLKKSYTENWERHSDWLIDECNFRRRLKLQYLETN